MAFDENEGQPGEGPGAAPQDKFERQMFKGSWTCADCGKEITEMPFKPAEDRPIYCRDCYLKRRDQRRR